MLDFFFYGTLLDDDVRRAVMPHQADRVGVRPAVLPGFRRVRARGESYPVLKRAQGRRLKGLLVEGLDRASVLAMAHFEGKDYHPEPVMVRDDADNWRRAYVFMPTSPRLAGTRRWDKRQWELREKAQIMPRIERWFSEFGAVEGNSNDISWRMRRWLATQDWRKG